MLKPSPWRQNSKWHQKMLGEEEEEEEEEVEEER